MIAPSLVLKEILIDEGVFAEHTGSWPLFVSSLPDMDNAGVLYDTAGTAVNRDLTTGEYAFAHGFQLKVQAGDYSAGYSKACTALQYLESVKWKEVVIDKETILINSVTLTSPILFIGHSQDKRRLNMFTLNGLVRFL
jgi:hypothetical protein